LDIFMVRKLGVPGHEELAMGAIATGGVIVWNDEVLGDLHMARDRIDAVVASERTELARRERTYRGNRPPPQIENRTVILVDDGLATGASMRAAARALREQHPATLVVAVPVAAAETCRELRREVDDVVCAATPEPFYAVGLWYHDFAPTSDEEVADLLAQAEAGHSPGVAP
jgi:predicted phosphoribosyltransferase